jgi:hypothetical protein
MNKLDFLIGAVLAVELAATAGVLIVGDWIFCIGLRMAGWP